MTTTTPRIYVACLASYNSGTLHGAWIDAGTDADAIRGSIAKILQASPFPNVEIECPDCTDGFYNDVACAHCGATGKVPSAEEWAIHDYEGFCGIKLSESHDLEEVAALAALIEEQDDGDLIAAAAACSSSTDAEDLRTFIEDNYQGSYDSLAEWAESMCEECDDGSLKNLPAFIRYHIDWETVATNELIMGGDYTEHRVNGSHYIFRND